MMNSTARGSGIVSRKCRIASAATANKSTPAIAQGNTDGVADFVSFGGS
jgi:hypothetical protein